MTDATARHAMPFLLPGQAQKELFHNEALALADMLLHPAVETGRPTQPPDHPAAGQAWLVGAGATGVWHGRDDMLAGWTAGGWRFAAPRIGMTVREIAGAWFHWDGSGWAAGIGPALPSVPSPSGGSIIDAEARAAITSLIATLKSHGLID